MTRYLVLLRGINVGGRTKSRLGKIVGTPAYKSMTIRSWTTTMALLERMDAPKILEDGP